MHIVHGLPQSINDRPTVLTIGAFDGLHLGHQHLIGGAIARAQALGWQSAVMTFDPHPELIIHPERRRLYLTSLEERSELIKALGADLLIVMPFTPALMAVSAEEFVTLLCGALALRELWIGWDFALGRKREGNATRLRELGHERGFSVHPVTPLLLDGVAVSSSRIRAALGAGDVALAATLLGHPFGLRGVVVQGDQRGRTIGFPTANVTIDEQHMLPADGVYICAVETGGGRYSAVTNVGLRPTFDGTRRTVEAYLLDFTGDLYGELLRLEFRDRLRGEQKFSGVADLVAQINRDVADTRAWLVAHM